MSERPREEYRASDRLRPQGALLKTPLGITIWLCDQHYLLPGELNSKKAFRVHWHPDRPPEVEWEGKRVELQLVTQAELDASDQEFVLRRYTEELAGPLEVFVMSLARELHQRERPGDDWFGLVGSSVTSYCRRACEARDIDWDWVLAAIQNERVDETIERR